MNIENYLSLSMKHKHTIVDIHVVHRLRDQFVGGDDRAYSSIYELYAKDLYAFGLSLQAKSDLIEDAIHDVFVDIYTHRYNLQKVDNLKFYFFAAFRNRLFFLLKKESKNSTIAEHHTLGMVEMDSQESWIASEVEDEKKLLIKKLFAELNDHQKEALHHRFVEGLSLEEISDLMNINYQSAKNLIHRAVKKMKAVAVFTLLFLLLFCF